MEFRGVFSRQRPRRRRQTDSSHVHVLSGRANNRLAKQYSNEIERCQHIQCVFEHRNSNRIPKRRWPPPPHFGGAEIRKGKNVHSTTFCDNKWAIVSASGGCRCPASLSSPHLSSLKSCGWLHNVRGAFKLNYRHKMLQVRSVRAHTAVPLIWPRAVRMDKGTEHLCSHWRD